MKFLDRLQHAWNAFISDEKKETSLSYMNLGYSSTYNPYQTRFTSGNERSIISSIYNRIAIDVASVDLSHVRLDDKGRYAGDIVSDLNDCLKVEANKDQTARQFIQDIVMSLFDEGHIAIVPIDTTTDLTQTNSFDIQSMRRGKILQWYPDYVQLEVYNDRKGIKENITMPKRAVAIIENPFYAIMNEKNSTLQRLVRKLNLLDSINEQSSSGKLDLIIQLPYIIKTEARKKQAEERRQDIERQLSGSKYGIAYTDGTEHITQLNRPVENNLLNQIEYETRMLYSQLNITPEILDGSADEKIMTNYMNRTVEPVIAAIANECNRKFLTKTARTQGQRIMYFNDPFKLVTVTNIAEIADKFTRNEIMSSNEVRQIIGMRPSNDPKADELRNKNLNPGEGQEFASTNDTINLEKGGKIQNG